MDHPVLAFPVRRIPLACLVILGALLQPRLLQPRLLAQHRLMTSFAPAQRDSALQTGFFASSSWLLRAQGALGAVTPPSGVTDEADLSHYPARDHGWLLTMSEAVTLYEGENRTSIELRCSQQLHANRRNDVSFNPRAAVWDEELSMKDILPSIPVEVSASVFHRCKHDIDNSDAEEGDSIALGNPQKRTIILGGVSLSGVVQPSVFTHPESPLRLMLDARLEGTWYAKDYRYPFVAFGPSWSDMRGSVQAGATVEYRVSRGFSGGLRASSTGAVFAASGNRSAAVGFDTMIEAFGTVIGTKGDLVISVQWRSVYDHGIRITADAARFVSLGLTVRPH